MKKKMIILIAAVLAVALVAGVLALVLGGGKGRPAAADPIDDNFRTFYQIFVGSFSDSNGDGIGDLQGIINRFDYLNDGNMNSETSLGVQGIWLSPIFTSPSYHKYDARDYYEVDPKFGTMEDLQELIELCHSRNVKLILDLAINHTSSQHEWFLRFQQARKDGDTANPYYNYYTCVTNEEKVNGCTYQIIPGTDYWFERNFSSEMPELDFDNPEVRQAMLDVAKFYMDMGIDGFRFDAVKYIYYGDTAQSVEFWEWYMEELRKINPEVYCVGECWSGEAEILEYYSALNCFNFAGAQAEGVFASAAKGSDISKFTGYLAYFQERVQQANPDGMVMSFLSNHDMDRIAGAFVFDNYMRMAANLYLLAPGSPVIYYGEEIGIRGSRGGANTDANRRLAMLWGDGDTVSNPEGTTYDAKNQITSTVADQVKDENSMYRYYCNLLTIRHNYPAIARGTYTAVNSSKNLGGFVIEYEGETLVLLHNTDTEAITVDLSAWEELSALELTRLCEAIGAGEAALQGTTLTIGAHTSVLLG